MLHWRCLAIFQEEDTIKDGRVYVEHIAKEEPERSEDRKSNNKLVSSTDTSNDKDSGFIEHCARAGRKVKLVPIYNPSPGKAYINIAATQKK